MKKNILFIIAIIVFNTSSAQPFKKKQFQKDNNSLLWEISGNGLNKPSYLFGTFHLLCKDDLPVSDNLKKALHYSKSLYLEMDMDDPANTIGALKDVNMKDGKTMKDILSKEGYEKLQLFFKDSLKMGLTIFEKMKPVFLSSLLYPSMLGCKNISGAEQEIMKLAKPDKKEIKGLETSAFQASIIDFIPYKLQAISLLNMIDSFSAYKIEFNKMLESYKSQKLSEIEMAFKDDPTLGGQKEILLDNRNITWVAKLEKIMKEENIFLAVGAGHLVGEKGLIQLLRNEGYTLRAIRN